MWRAGATPRLALLLALAALIPVATLGQRRQLAPTVMINGFGDLEGLEGSPATVCSTTLVRARPVSRAVSFALAVHPMAPDKASLESWTIKDAQGRNVAASPDALARWQAGLQACFGEAVALGFTTLHVLGHWDPLHPVLLRPTSWRNLMNIAPRQKAGGYSYEDVLVKPVVAALNAVASPAVAVWFSVSGEMGLSNFLAPRPWLSLMADTRRALRAKKWQDVKVATALNWQMACGCIAAQNPAPGSFDPIRYNASYAEEFEAVKQYAAPFGRELKALLEGNDYLGLSAYGSAYPTSPAALNARHMEAPLQTLAYELSFFGIDLRQLVDARQLPVLYVEQGLGGVLRHGMLPADDLATVARYPFSGNWPVDGYSKEVDPWKRPDFAAYRRAFYQASLDLLARGASGPQQWRVDGMYVWSVGSFDVWAVHPVSSSARGSFADPQIVAAIAQHNRRFAGR